MLVYRIVWKHHSQSLLAPGVTGRWNSNGRKVIYTAESISLAFLESMIRRKGIGFNDDFKIMIIEIPDDLQVTTVSRRDLSPEWRDPKDYAECQSIGDDWYDQATTPVLKVPSAVLHDSFNFVINTTHTDYGRIALLETVDLIPDERIEDILKRYTR